MFPFRRNRSPHPVPLWRRYRRFFRPDVDADVEDELRFHLEMRIADYERLGHSREEAERLANARFGEVEEVRDWLTRHDRQRQRGAERSEIMDSMLQDVRYAARRLRQRPGFALTVVLVLGLGIGAATTMFSAVDAALLRPLPFQRDDRLVAVHSISIPLLESTQKQRSLQIDDVRAMRGIFTRVAAYAPGAMNLSDPNAPRRLDVALVTPDLFATLGVRLAVGRGFSAEEGKPGGARVAIISDGLWRRQYGGDPAITGKDVRLNDVPYQVVGVMPPGFRFPDETEVWLPLTVPTSWAQYEAFRGWMPTTVVARLAPGATTKGADAAVITSMRQRQTAEQRTEPLGGVVAPLRDVLVAERRTPLLVLMGATALVLLVACANVANLLLSRALAQRGELALRAALGASRGRIVRQLLVESVLLALSGGAAGIAMAFAGVRVLGAIMPPQLAGAAPARVDVRVLAFSVATALFTGLVSGVWPALRASRADANDTIRSNAPTGSTGREGTWMRRTFVVTELALALMLAVGAGLMLRSLGALLATDTGVRPAAVATLELTLPRAAYLTATARRQFFEQVTARMRELPGVTDVAAVNELPLRGNGGIFLSVEAEGRTVIPGTEGVFAQPLYTTPSYFATLGIPLRRGRTFSVPYDSTRPPEVIVNETMARKLWPGEDAIGKRIKGLMPGSPSPVVVAVVGDVRPVSLESERQAQMYYDLASMPPSNAALLARGTLPPEVLATRLREAVRAVDPTQAVYNVRPMTEVIAGAIAPRRTNTTLLTLFGIVAVGLAAMGVYGVIAYGVTRRTKEIGIRMALGAQPRNILALIAREGVLLALLGIAIGAAGAWALRRVLGSLLYGVTPDDPLAFAGAAVVLLVIALVATLIPARAALRVDPARTIRVE